MSLVKLGAGLAFALASQFAMAQSCPCDDSRNKCTYLDDTTKSILDEQDGWASFGEGVTGGAAGELIYWVTTLDEGTGPGTLRSALKASGSCPLWIKFDVSGKITVTQDLIVNSNKTLDGRGASIVIDSNTQMTAEQCANDSGGTKTDGLVIEGEKNVAILNIEINDNFEHWNTDCDGSDGIRIEDSHHVWIYHNTIKKWADGGIDINAGSNYVTIANNSFKKIYQGVAIRDGNTSFHSNYCNEVLFRCPNANYLPENSENGVYVHQFNNVIKDWRGDNVIQAKGVKSMVLSEHDMFLAGEHTLDTTIIANKDGGTMDVRNAHSLGPDITIIENGKADEDWKNTSRSLISRRKCDNAACYGTLADEIMNAAGATL